MPDYLLILYLHTSSGISSVTRHNPYINFFVFHVLTQELFLDKIHFFKFLYMSGKPRIGQLKVITDTRGTSFSDSLNLSMGTSKGK